MKRILLRSRKVLRSFLVGGLRDIAYQRHILNEALNIEKQVIFIAVPKTGTTSVRRQLAQRGRSLIPNPHLNIMQVRDAIYTFLLKEALGRNRTFPTEGVPSDEELRRSAKEIFSSFFKFSGVRNPWARAVSLYMRREGIQVADKMSFEEFCEQLNYASDTCRHPTLHSNQLDWLCDDSGRSLMDYVYRLEDFDQAIKEIAERTDGRLQLVSINANSNPKSLSRSYRDLYTDHAREMIAARFEKDIDHFKYTF